MKNEIHQSDVPKKRTLDTKSNTKKELSYVQKLGAVVGFSLWTVAVFYGVQLILALAIGLVLRIDGTFMAEVSMNVFNTIMTTIVYILSSVFAIGIPLLLFKQKTTRKEVGLEQTLPYWRDLGIAPVVFIISNIVTIIAMWTLGQFTSSDWMSQPQEVGFEAASSQIELLLVYFSLCFAAPVAEEFLFRGYMYGKIRKHASAFITITLTGVIFGALHLFGNPEGLQWNVMLNTVILGLALGILREKTGSIWAGIIVHMIKNSLAFFVLFIAPMLGVNIIGG